MDQDKRRARIWQIRQRQLYKSHQLTPARILALEATEGWKWEEEDPFEENRLNWSSQYEKLGHYPSVRSKNPYEKRAGKWQIRQRQLYKSHQLTPARISALEATEGWKWEEEDRFEENRLNWSSQYENL